MRKSTDHILTSHAGSLPRTPELIAANAAKESGDVAHFDELLTASVIDLVERQKAIGIDVPGDGEYGKSMSSAVDYGAWWSYSFDRVSGLEIDPVAAWALEQKLSTPGNPRLTGFVHRRDRKKFSEAYADPESGIFTGGPKPFPKVVGKLEYTGQAAINSDIANLKAGLDSAGYSEGFITSLSPGSASRITNDYYGSEEEYIWAWADVLREEYRAIIDAGLVLQIDDPSISENFDQIEPEPSVEDYLKFTRIRVEALNYALRDLPEEQIRFHLCWGSWHGPHTTDFELKYLVDLMLEIRAGAYSFEAANVRHEHEWRVWEDNKLPEGKLIIPGIVSHATNVVEHPELVADRIERFAGLVGRENIIAATDCGLGGRIHPQIAVAKLETLVAGARIASERLYK
ncbi:MAG: cobalamin-independent methionine synthase II family protein [Microbacteriaceae bacterium]